MSNMYVKTFILTITQTFPKVNTVGYDTIPKK